MRFWITLTVCIMLSACLATPGYHLQVNTPPPPYRPSRLRIVHIDPNVVSAQRTWYHNYVYHVGAHDVVMVTVWDHPELTMPQGQYRSSVDTGILVQNDGTIFYPYAGRLKIAGKTVEEIRTLLTQRLKRYVRDPQIGVKVVGYFSKRIHVIGAVGRQMTQSITNVPLSIMDAINKAGGVAQATADPSAIFVIRESKQGPVAYWINLNSPEAMLLASNFYLRSHDVLYVSTADSIHWRQLYTDLLTVIQSYWALNHLGWVK